MDVVISETIDVLQKGEPCVLATVICTKGSTPQKPGARILIKADGSSVGTVGGGCVEAEIWSAATRLLREGGDAMVLDYNLNDELAAQDGLVCGGTISFLVQPIFKPQPSLDQVREVGAALEGGRPVAFAHVIRPPAGVGLRVGDRLFIRENGESVGTLGKPTLEEAAIRTGRELMAQGKCELLTTGDGTVLFIEAHTSPPTLVLYGGGHVGKAVVPLAKTLGFRVFVVDDRREFVSRERFPQADGLIHSSYEEGMKRIPVNTNTYVVVATRGHQFDDVATEAAVRSPAGYVAIVGSKRKTLLVLETLFKKGIPEERLRQIRAPVGLDIGARTPEEIAVSIMAEILMCRLGGTGQPLKLDERLFLKAKEKATATPVAD